MVSSVASQEPAEQPAAPPKKLLGRQFYESMGSPKYIVAPMVDRSEFVGSVSPVFLRLQTNLVSSPGLAHAHSILYAG